MRGRTSKQEAREEMEIDKPHLSGAYIRSLVKHLSTSSRNKDPDCVDHAQNLNNFGEVLSETPQSQQPQPPQKQHKKQVRRRLHTSRPYQEKLLNMAEARREIVTALKFHRATMKQAQQNQSQQPLQPPLEPQTCLGQEEGKLKSRRNPRMLCPSGTPNFPNPFSWPAVFPPPPAENLNFPLPDQALGLNLNFQDFNNLDTNMYHSSHNPPIYSSSSQSSSSSEVPSAAISRDVTESGIGLHPVMGEGEMAEIRSIGEQHQMEWNDTMNMVTSARWFEFLKTMELEKEVKKEDDDGYHLFDEIMEFPTWLNATDSCLQQHLDDCYSEDYVQDPALPCMDIEEIDGMDGEWLA